MKNGSGLLQRAQARVAAAGGHHIGDLIAWNTDRINVSRLEARRLFASEGLGNLIPDLDPATALSRAAGEVRRPEGIVVRPFAKPRDDTPAAVGIYEVKSRAGEAGDDYLCGARCRVNLKSGLIIALPPDGAAVIDVALAHAEAVAGRANHVLTHCETKDLSAALVGTVKALSGVPLRDRGGFYLLPPSTCATWTRLGVGLEAIGVRAIRIEMHDAPSNVSVAKAAAQGALEADIQELMIDLDKAVVDGMRTSALTRRVEVCRELRAKAELYRGVLEGITDKITFKVGELEQRFRNQLGQSDGGMGPDGSADNGPGDSGTAVHGTADDELFSLAVHD